MCGDDDGEFMWYTVQNSCKWCCRSKEDVNRTCSPHPRNLNLPDGMSCLQGSCYKAWLLYYANSLTYRLLLHWIFPQIDSWLQIMCRTRLNQLLVCTCITCMWSKLTAVVFFRLFYVRNGVLDSGVHSLKPKVSLIWDLINIQNVK